MSEPGQPAAGQPAAATTDGPASSAAGTPAAGTPAAASPDAPQGDRPTDPARRRFFREFAQELFQTAATVVGAATALQRSSAEAAGAILNPSATFLPPVVDETAPTIHVAPPVGFRTAFRLDDERLLLIDQRRLPNQLVEIECRTANDVAHEIREMTIRGAPAVGQAAALGLALTARRSRTSQPYARSAIVRAGSRTLLAARPTSRYIHWTVDRLISRFDGFGASEEDGEAIATAMLDEAEAIVAEATADHGRLIEAGLGLLPPPGERPLAILTHGSTGVLGGGQVGTALAIAVAAAQAGRELVVYVDESRPNLEGARITTWELTQAGVQHVLIADGAAGWLLAAGRVDLVLVGAERIAANGDTANDVGTYPLAAVAARHGVPFYVCAPLGCVDPDTSDGTRIPIEQRSAVEVTRLAGVPVAPPETAVLNPVYDVTPHDLIRAFVNEEGIIEPPFGRTIEAAIASRAARYPAPPPREPAVP